MMIPEYYGLPVLPLMITEDDVGFAPDLKPRLDKVRGFARIITHLGTAAVGSWASGCLERDASTCASCVRTLHLLRHAYLAHHGIHGHAPSDPCTYWCPAVGAGALIHPAWCVSVPCPDSHVTAGAAGCTCKSAPEAIPA
jgi:hypothetical protein